MPECGEEYDTSVQIFPSTSLPDHPPLILLRHRRVVAGKDKLGSYSQQCTSVFKGCAEKSKTSIIFLQKQKVILQIQN